MNFFLFVILFLNIQYSISFIRLEGNLAQTVITAVTFLLSDNQPEIPKIDITKKPKVSVVIPVYNEEKYIKNVLKSIQYQKLKEVEIIFVDDKSTDNSVKKILEFQKTDPRIKLIQNSKNRGILYNRIYGGLQARGEYVAFIDADDLYANPDILDLAYKKSVKNNLDILEFDYFGGRFNIDTLEFKDVFLFSNENKQLYDKLYLQPEIKKSFFYAQGKEDIFAGIIYNKLYSHREIEKMADCIGPEFWNQHFIYMEDFIMVYAVARTAERVMLISYGGVFHWYENPDGMTDGVFELDAKKKNLKNPEQTNKKLGDYLSMWERAFDMTEDEPDSEYFRLKLIFLLKSPDNRNVFALTYHYERIINLCKRMYNWKFSSQFAKNFAKEFAQETIDLEIPMKKKYYELYGGDDMDDIDDDDYEIEIKKKKNKKKKKKKNKKNKDNNDNKENNENNINKEKNEKKENYDNNNNKKTKKKSKITEEIDGYIDNGDEL